MKIELKKETKYPNAPWYTIELDGEFQFGTYNEEDAKKAFQKIKTDPFMFKKGIEVLDSHEIVVPLQEKKEE